MLLNIECSADVLKELETGFRFNDAVLRHLIVNREDAGHRPVLHPQEQGRKGDSPS